jgi:predicted metal-dependent phosphoesterase TrpH
MKSFRGIIHIHSKFSYDGQHSLEQIAQFGREHGYSFLGITEHSDSFDKTNMSQLTNTCYSLSSAHLLIIPGIEFTCKDNMHILGLGIQNYIESNECTEIIHFIHQQNGIAIIAHPSRYNYRIPSELARKANGIEVWNVAYDGRFIPNAKSLYLFKNLSRINSSLLAFGGNDLHTITNRRKVETILFSEQLDREEIIHALREGNFKISNSYFSLDSRTIQWLSLSQIYVLRHLYILAKNIREHMRPRVDLTS